MKRDLLVISAAVAIAAEAMVVVPPISVAQTPPMGGGYTNVIPIPVDDPNIKAIAGALFKPEGAGPFPGVVFMSGCAGLSSPPDMAMQKTVIDHLLAKGIAVLMVDPFTPRNEPEGICANLNGGTFVKYATRGGNDVAALKLLKATLGVDPNRTFLQGHSWGRYRRSSPWTRTLRRCTTPRSPDSSYYPYCWDNVQSSAPTLVLIGEQDDWTPAALCQAVKNKPNFEIVVFPDSYHAFVSPMGKPVDYLGHHIAYNENAALEAQQRADAFLDAHLK